MQLLRAVSIHLYLALITPYYLGYSLIPTSAKGDRNMKLTDAEKLILLMLCDLSDGKKEIDPEFIRDAIYNDATWGIPWKYHGFESGNRSDNPVVEQVCNILNMYRVMDNAYRELSAEDKALVDASSRAHRLKYIGFDGNNESEHLSVVEFLVQKLGRYTELEGKESLNSHTPMLDNYLDMERKYMEITTAKTVTFITGNLTAAEIIQIIEA